MPSGFFPTRPRGDGVGTSRDVPASRAVAFGSRLLPTRSAEDLHLLSRVHAWHTKIALDESRLLILGAQVLFGFQFNGVFQQEFDKLPFLSRVFVAAGLTLIMIAVGLLIAPSMQHRIVGGGQDSRRVLALATLCTGAVLLPVASALSLDIYAAMERIAAQAAGQFPPPRSSLSQWPAGTESQVPRSTVPPRE